MNTASVASTLRQSGALSAAVLTSRVLGLVREALFAALFGAGVLADAYQVAFRIPNLLRDLFAEGALSSAFVPTFAAVREGQGEAAARRLANLVLGGVLLATGAIAALGILYAEAVVRAISAGFAGDAAKVALAVDATRLMMPLLPLVSVAAVWMGVLNAERRFLVPAFAPAVFNLVLLAAGTVLWWHGGAAEQRLLWWSAATTLAGAAQAGVQVPALWRMGARPLPRLRGLLRDAGVRRIVRLMAPAVLGLAAVQLNVFVNTRFASELGDGPVAQLSYAFRLFYLPIGMFGVALATVTTTKVAEDAARADVEGLSRRTGEGLSAAWMLTAASAVGLFVLADPIVATIFERGRFSAADTAATADVLRAYAVGLLPYSLVKILAPAFYATNRPRIPLAASVAAVAVNLGFNAATYRVLGAPGIAFGTTLGAFVNVGVLRLAYARHIGPVRTFRDGRDLAVLLGALGMLAGISVVGAAAIDASVAWAGHGASPVAVRFVRAVVLAGVIAVAAWAYVGILARLGYPGGALLATLPRRLIGRLRGRGRAGADAGDDPDRTVE